MTAKTSRIARRAGAVFTLDSQSDIWQGQYKLIERTAPNTWTVEYLPDPPETAERIRAMWAERKANGWWSPDGEAEREIAARAARAGTRSTVKFISSKKWHEYF